MMVVEVPRCRICLSLFAAVLGPGCLVVDWSHNPHAKFHNGLTMGIRDVVDCRYPLLLRIDLSPNGYPIKTATVYTSLYGEHYVLS